MCMARVCPRRAPASLQRHAACLRRPHRTHRPPGHRAKIFAMARTALHITGDDKADALLSRDPLALLIGMVLDQQVPIEKAFTSPSALQQRLGTKARLDAAAIAAMDPDELGDLFRERPAL